MQLSLKDFCEPIYVGVQVPVVQSQTKQIAAKNTEALRQKLAGVLSISTKIGSRRPVARHIHRPNGKKVRTRWKNPG